MYYIVMGYIYIIKNSFNDKVYIGQTKTKSIQHPWRRHKKNAKDTTQNRPIVDAMRIIGVDNFKIEMLQECSNELLDEMEIKAIQEHNSLHPNGYNYTAGGQGPSKQSCEELKNKNSEAQKKRFSDPNKRKQMSNSRAEMLGSEEGDKWKKEHGKKMRAFWKSEEGKKSIEQMRETKRKKRDPLYDGHVKKIAATKNFHNKYAEPPKSKGTRDEGNEAALGRYMIKTRSEYRKGGLSQRYKTLIEREWAPWFVWDPLAENHISNINKIKTFIDTHHCLPSSRGIRNDGNERTLGQYLVTIRRSKNKNKLPETIINLVEEKLSPLFSWDPKTEERNIILNNIARFYNTYGEEPKQNGIRENGDEAKMSAYISQRRNNKKKGTLNEDIEKQINKALPWFKWETSWTHRPAKEKMCAATTKGNRVELPL